MKTYPKVSCIMPTANRHKYIPLALHYFLNQSYRNAELIIVDDGKDSIERLLPEHSRIKYFYSTSKQTIGQKRNYACDKSIGEIILHWDDDDYYGQEWISRSVLALENSKADICGLNEILFFSPLQDKYWKYADKNSTQPWLAGATMAYRKCFWQLHPFNDVQVGEDYDFIWNNGATLFAHDYLDGFIALLHADNTTLKPFENSRLKKHATALLDKRLQKESN